ncbi:class I SAM-dependent methyltransferase [Nocardioides donggukensis]|uniref:Class I SAM-dependent methyltransferase n=1 Tax=Nocardioides donggukensis TaxID=2774019 RepID=A0A927PZS4_9ACTN|nr:class I SAM-dependent methyltransferase [Nocardioides donggukensis]MBD8870718.1 class I SAM-dependent methyltransferase [Nocardioides donggukensis]
MSHHPADWDAEASTFDDEPDHGLTDPATREAWRSLLRAALPAAPARIADLGCGTGTLTVLLAEEGHRVHGVDFAPAMVERARRKAQDAGLDVDLTVADAAAPGLEPAAYDAVLCRHVLWALPDPVAALRGWFDLLAPGGRLVLVEGRWGTGAGIGPGECRRLVELAGGTAEVRPLPDPVYWGRPIDDERYLVVGRA